VSQCGCAGVHADVTAPQRPGKRAARIRVGPCMGIPVYSQRTPGSSAVVVSRGAVSESARMFVVSRGARRDMHSG